MRMSKSVVIVVIVVLFCLGIPGQKNQVGSIPFPAPQLLASWAVKKEAVKNQVGVTNRAMVTEHFDTGTLKPEPTNTGCKLNDFNLVLTLAGVPIMFPGILWIY